MTSAVMVHDDTVTAPLREAEADLLDRLAKVRGLIREAEGSERGPWLSFAEAWARRSAIGERFGLGIPLLDTKLEGGLFGGTVTTIQGKPGIGKTLLATQFALHLGRRCAIAALFADEGLPGAIVRIGQQLGRERRALVANDPEIVQKVCHDFEPRCPTFHFLDPQSPLSTVEFLATEMKARCDGKQQVWLIDSAQIARTARHDKKDDRRNAISKLYWAVRELAIEHSAVAIVISQVGRGAYRAKKEEEQIDPLAAGLESSAIEFMSDLILSLHGTPTQDKPTAQIRAVKNRISAAGNFAVGLRLDYGRAMFFEEAAALEEGPDPVITRKEAEADKVVLDFIQRYPGSSSRVHRESIRYSAATIDHARKRLLAKQLIYCEPGAYNALRWFPLVVGLTKPKPQEEETDA